MPDKTPCIMVDELLGLAYDAYAKAHLSSDALTKQKLTRAAEDYMKRAKEMRRERFSNS
jgi:hypothetical protein